MAHYTEIKELLVVGDTVDYPSTGNQTSKLSVTKTKENNGSHAYRLSNTNQTFNIEIYHVELARKINKEVNTESVKDKRVRLKGVADALGLVYKKNIKTDKLEELIANKTESM